MYEHDDLVHESFPHPKNSYKLSVNEMPSPPIQPGQDDNFKGEMDRENENYYKADRALKSNFGKYLKPNQ